MSVKASISLTDQQEAFARSLVAEGRYASLSAVLQHGLDLLRHQTEANNAEIEALRLLLDNRRSGPFISTEAGQAATQTMLAEKKRTLGL